MWAQVRRGEWPLAPSNAAGVLVFSVPLLDHAGAVVERILVAVTSQTAPAPANLAEIVSAARRVIEQQVSSRLSRVRALMRRSAADGDRLDRMLVARIAAEWVPVAVQPGLFDAREIRAFDAAREAGHGLDEDLAARLDRHRQRAAIDVGRPLLELVLGVRTQ